MTQGKHTGWHVDRTGEGTKIKDAAGNTVLWTQHTHLHGRRTDEEVRQIADLSAAAPDLLKALIGLLAANDAVQLALCDGPEVPGFDPTALGRAQLRVTEAEDVTRAVIAKAEGRP